MCRPLNAAERDVLVAMLSRADQGPWHARPTVDMRSAWLKQVDRLSVGRACDCGTCPSVELVLDGQAATDDGGDRVILTASVQPGREDLPDMVLLFIDDGVPTYLEAVPGSDDPVTWPDVRELQY